MRYAIIEKEMCERVENVMAQESVLDRATYKKIKGMSREEMQKFLLRYADNLKSDSDIKEIDLSEVRSKIGQVKGIGEKRLDDIMDILEKHIGV